MSDHYTVATDFERPDPALVQRAAAAIFVFAAMAAGPRQVMDAGIKPLDPDWRICGPAFTVRAEFPEDTAMGYLALVHARPGDVLVIDAAGRMDCAAFGASMARGAKQAGAAGVVLDGLCESAGLIRTREGMPVFCRGASPHVLAQERPGWLNVPVICGRVIVHPGDIVIGDADGVAVLPKDRAADIVAAAEQRGAPYRGPNPLRSVPFRDSHAAAIARISAMPGLRWK